MLSGKPLIESDLMREAPTAGSGRGEYGPAVDRVGRTGAPTAASTPRRDCAQREDAGDIDQPEKAPKPLQVQETSGATEPSAGAANKETLGRAGKAEEVMDPNGEKTCGDGK